MQYLTMNKKLEEAVAGLRCVNKPVKQIAKTLSVRKDDIEKIIKDWIIETEPFLDKLVRERKVRNVPDTKKMISLMKDNTETIIKNPEILDYIAKKRNDHHDRFMDCIRYKIKIYLDEKKE
jgi:hypothetical protein